MGGDFGEDEVQHRGRAGPYFRNPSLTPCSSANPPLGMDYGRCFQVAGTWQHPCLAPARWPWFGSGSSDSPAGRELDVDADVGGGWMCIDRFAGVDGGVEGRAKRKGTRPAALCGVSNRKSRGGFRQPRRGPGRLRPSVPPQRAGIIDEEVCTVLYD